MPDETVDLLLSVSGVTTLDVVPSLLDESALRGRELEWPQEVAGLLEGWSDRVDLVDQVLNANNIVLSQSVLDDGVVGKIGKAFDAANAEWDQLDEIIAWDCYAT